MKTLITIPIIFLLFLGIATATDIYTDPYNDLFNPESELGKNLDTIRAELGISSCYVDANWESKSCDYLYYCMAILPYYSTSISDALLKECNEVTDKATTELKVIDFVPPKGILYYVTTFVTVVHYNYDDGAEKWNPTPEIPNTYINAHDIRSVCPTGQMLGMERDPLGVPVGPKCYIAERVCIDNFDTGVCTNAYPLYVLDMDENGDWLDNIGDASNYCKDSNLDRICDFTIDLECVDICSDFTLDASNNFVCAASGPNGLCDEWDMAAEYSCLDAELSPNSNICDDVDVEGCLKDYDPVCIGGTGGTTYPNACFAEAQGYTSADWTLGACEPPITQCYDPTDCPDTNVCLGGSTAGITKLCLNYMCSYTGACGNLACNVDADCEGMVMPCVGVYPHCDTSICVIGGKCLEAPQPQKFSIWDLIAQIWNAFWNWILGLSS